MVYRKKEFIVHKSVCVPKCDGTVLHIAILLFNKWSLIHMLIFQEFRAKMQPSNSTNRMNMVRSSSYTSLESASEQQPTSSLRRQQSAPNSQNTTPLKSINNSASNSLLRATADSRVRTHTDCWYSRTCLERQLLLPASLL